MSGRILPAACVPRSWRAAPAAALVFLLALTALPETAGAQYTQAPPPAAYALQNVTVVSADGARQPGMTLVVRDGLIEAMGADVTVPEDARVLEGDSLMVYPGFVDAAGELEVAFPEAGDEDREITSWNPPRDVAGLLPHRRIADHLVAEEKPLEDLRKQGVIAAAVHPDDAMMPGRSAFVLLRTGADGPRDLVLDPEVGSVMAFEGARAYPSTLFGMIAYMRQAFLDASHQGEAEAAYASRGSGLTVPRWDPDYEVLRRISGGELRTFFRAENVRDIRHALNLADQFDLRLTIVGGREAWRAADELAAGDVPVLVSLDFPTPERWKPEAEEEETPPDSAAAEGAEAEAEQAEELEPEVLREKERIENAYRNAGRLVEAGVTVALTSGDGGAELREGARKAVEYGLSEDAALRALTSTPASMFGHGALTRIRRGAAANFQVTSGPVFAEDTEVRYVFVDGRLQIGQEPGAEPEEAPAVNVGGAWDITVETSQGSFEGTATLEQEDDGTVSGTFSSQMGEMDVADGVVSGDTFSFTLSVTAGGQEMELSLSGTVEGDSMSGTGSGPFGSFTWEAERTGGGPGGLR